MLLREDEPLGPKTTMRIGGTARYFAELATQEDVEEAYAFAQKHGVPIIVLGSGSNTIFADGEIHALVVRIAAQEWTKENSTTLHVSSGKNLPMLINELAKEGWDLSPLTGIPGTVGGAIFGNAGQGPKGIWMDHFIESVTVFDGEWKTLTKKECAFSYRESIFKQKLIADSYQLSASPIIWSCTLSVPTVDAAVIQAEIERLLQKRIETQPHQRTAGSCFKAIGDTPAWQLIDAAGLRGTKHGGVMISEKHANFLISEKGATFQDAMNVVHTVQEKILEKLEVEMRFVQADGSLRY
ncbi:UDP-N-acetylmuramate dehydrogenase [Candidatus Peribacteria bacterium]|nr:UDP-N-acetylmuramate dehydrogenase [Candidatus Peribacteria bacterium]